MSINSMPLEGMKKSLDNVNVLLSNIKSGGAMDRTDRIEKVCAVIRQIATDANDSGLSAIEEATQDLLGTSERIRNREISPNSALYDAMMALVSEIKTAICPAPAVSLQDDRDVLPEPATAFCKLAHQYHTDKAPGLAGHSYTPIYDQLFGPIRHDITKVLEIGIGPTIYKNPRRVIAGAPPNPFDPDLVQISGASLRTLAAYFPNAEVYGTDIVPGLLFEEKRIKTFLCDQSSETQLHQFAMEHGPFDLIIDDGSHMPAHQILSFFTLFEFVRQGGCYVIEDVSAKDLFFDPFYSPSEQVCRIADPRTREKVFRQVQYCANYSLNGYGFGYQNATDDHLILFKKLDQRQTNHFTGDAS